MWYNDYIIEHNMNMQWHIGIWQSHIQHMGGWLSPCTAITAYSTIWSLNKAIWARRTKCHSPPYPYNYENNKLSLNYLMHMWAVPRESHLPQSGLD